MKRRLRTDRSQRSCVRGLRAVVSVGIILTLTACYWTPHGFEEATSRTRHLDFQIAGLSGTSNAQLRAVVFPAEWANDLDGFGSVVDIESAEFAEALDRGRAARRELSVAGGATEGALVFPELQPGEYHVHLELDDGKLDEEDEPLPYFGYTHRRYELTEQGGDPDNPRFECTDSGDQGAPLLIGSAETVRSVVELCRARDAVRLAWTFDTGGQADSSPALAPDGTLYVTSGNDDSLYAVNPNGTEKWRYETEGTVQSSPAIGSDGTVYFGSRDQFVYAVNPDGSFKWQYETNDQVIAAPAIGSDGTVYIGSGEFYALDGADGALLWALIDLSGYVQFGAAIAPNDIIYFSTAGETFEAVDSAGQEVDGFPVPETGGGGASRAAIGSDGTIYAGGDVLYAVAPDGTVLWEFEPQAHTEAPGDGPISNSPSIGPDGTIYVGSRDSVVSAVNPDDGSEIWSFEATYDDEGMHSAPAIDASGILYIGAPTALYAIDTATGQQLWRYDLGNALVYSSPVIGDDGMVYIGTDDGNLYAFDTMGSGPADSPWPMYAADQRNTGRR